MAWRPGSVSSQRLPGHFFRKMLSSGVNCVALKVGTSCTHIILSQNGWMAEMHLSSVCVNYSLFFFETNLLSFPNSMSNLLIETSAIRTLPKSLSLKHSSGNFGISSSSPFPKARNLEQRSLKTFVLQSFNKFTSLFPTLMGYHRLHSTHKAGPWTPLISNLFNVLSAVLKTGGSGGWLTAVAHWHMRYLLRRISCR